MAADLGGDGDQLVSEINITPFVDIILVVLIIFMVTTTAIVKQAIEVKLPDAASGSTSETSLALSIDVERRWYLDGAPITSDGLRARLRQEQAKGQEVTCLLAADHRVPHGEVVRAIDLIKQEGIARFAINIDPVPLPPEAP